MDKTPILITADTATEFTRALGGNPPPAPSVDDMRAALDDRLNEKIAVLEARHARMKADGIKPPRTLRGKIAAARRNLAEFHATIASPPPGFRLVPVWCVPAAEGPEAAREYTAAARRDALKRAAREDAAALRTLGVCDFGMACMRRGQTPVNAAGLVYDLSVDHHVVEQAMAGAAARVRDPELPPDAPEKFPVNHLSNLMIVTGPYHRRKNWLHDMQAPPRAARGQPFYRLSLIREDAARVIGPQPGGLPFCAPTPMGDITRLRHLRAVADDCLHMLTSDPDTQEALEDSGGVNGGAAAFNRLASPEARKLADTGLRPALLQMTSHLSDVFRQVARGPRTPAADRLYLAFAAACGTKAMQRFRARTGDLPFPEAAALHAAFAAVDAGMARLAPGVAARQKARAAGP